MLKITQILSFIFLLTKIYYHEFLQDTIYTHYTHINREKHAVAWNCREKAREWAKKSAEMGSMLDKHRVPTDRFTLYNTYVALAIVDKAQVFLS